MINEMKPPVSVTSTFYSTATEDDRKTFRDWLNSVLRTEDVTIHFLKKDGTNRVMNCTLQESKIQEYTKKTDRVKTVSNETCSVFDTDKNEWRSFRYDSVTQINFSISIGGAE